MEESMRIENATFVVTGGASGLGAGCVRLFAEAGAKVVVADLNRPAGEELVARLQGRARFVAVDVTKTDDVRSAIDAATREFGGLHGVVHCAGILHAERVAGKQGPHDLDAFRRTIEVNLVGTFNVIRLAAAAMTHNEPNADGERGVIITTASVSAFEGQIGQAAYAASKAGVAGLTLPVARELARFGIRVVSIAPGVFHTAMFDTLAPEQQQGLASQVPFPPRLGRPDEFASLARHIVENPMLNGEVIRLDGALRLAAKP
jgi:NAD(P)-dependent dehydrogenase (short-subunit alcohol dehydrogenase family)